MRLLFNDRLIKAIYRSVLKRDPDPGGYEHYRKRLRAGLSVEAMIAEFIGSDEFRTRFAPTARPGHDHQAPAFGSDHSQNGEFSIFVGHAKPGRNGIVVEVGTHGKKNSNSYDLLKQYGWRGLLVEANPNAWATIERDFAGLNYKLERAVVSDKEEKTNFYLGFISSLNPAMIEAWGHKPSSVIEVSTQRLGPILERNKIPYDFDLLSIDIEGMDIRVLNDLFTTTDYLPKWIWVEESHAYRKHSLRETAIVPKALQHYVVVARTSPNLLLKRLK